jgi:FkbM family methyltransferase
MPFISYAQNFEDVMLWRALKDVEKGFYIDVGANDPVIDSVTKAFYDAGWHGINIEPLKSHWEDLSAARPRDINLQCAAGDVSGDLEIWEADVRGWATASPEVIEKHQEGGHKGRHYQVSVKTLTEICAEHAVGDVHFLKVDVEGFEKQVLVGMNFMAVRPWIVVVEATIPDSAKENYKEWEAILLGCNYSFAYADGLNRYYISGERKKLKRAFKYPPNVFDDFVLHRTQQAEANIQEAQERVLQAEASIQEAQERIVQAEANIQELQRRALQAETDLEKAQILIGEVDLRQRQAVAEMWQYKAKSQGAQAVLEQTFAKLRQVEKNVQYNAAIAEQERRQLQTVQATISWRITRPLRGIRRVFRGDMEPFIKIKNKTLYILRKRFDSLRGKFVFEEQEKRKSLGTEDISTELSFHSLSIYGTLKGCIEYYYER